MERSTARAFSGEDEMRTATGGAPSCSGSTTATDASGTSLRSCRARVRPASPPPAMTTLAELGDLTRFESPRQLMSFLGLVPSEQSSGQRRRQGGITKTGNGHVRRVLVEAAWSYRFPARKTAHLRRKAAGASAPVQAIAWAAQKRLCGSYWSLYQAGTAKALVCTAIARELVGFIWAIAYEVAGKPHGTRALAS